MVAPIPHRARLEGLGMARLSKNPLSFFVLIQSLIHVSDFSLQLSTRPFPRHGSRHIYCSDAGPAQSSSSSSIPLSSKYEVALVCRWSCLVDHPYSYIVCLNIYKEGTQTPPLQAALCGLVAAPPSTRAPDQPHQLGPGTRARCRRGPVPGAGRMPRDPPGAVRPR